MDRRKNNGGHSTKPKSPNDKRLAKKFDYQNMIESMDDVLPPNDVWAIVANHIHGGDLKAIELWVKYRFGAPKQSIDVTSGGERLPALMVEVVRPDES